MCGGGGGGNAEGGSDTLKLGTFVAARHFSRQPADMTAEAGERRVAGSQDPSRSERQVTDGSFMLGPSWRGERAWPWTEKNGGGRVEEMSCDSIKTQQTLSTPIAGLSDSSP